MASGFAGTNGLGFAEGQTAGFECSSIQRLDEYLRFRHVVRNVYTFSFDPERVGRMVNELDVVFSQIREELLGFANFIEKVGME